MTNPFGKVDLPTEVNATFGNNAGLAVGKFLQFSLRLLIVGASVYALINLVLAGYAFMSAGDDSKKVAGAWAKITQTIIGLAFSAGAFVLAAIFGQLLFGDPNFILSPKIPEL